MKSTKTKLLIYITISLLVVTIASTCVWLYISTKEIRRFETRLGISLPLDTQVLFSEYDYGAMGDGSSLTIYRLNPDELQKLIQQNHIDHWPQLPIEQTLSTGIYKRFSGIAKGKINTANLLNLNADYGYYMIKNKHDKPLGQYDERNKNYFNIILGIINCKTNTIYLLTWDI